MDIKTKISVPLSQPEESPRVTAVKKQLRDVAGLYEKQFLREMVKQMRSTVSESQLQPANFAEKYYREQLDHQYVESWGDTGGIGLGGMIYDQLLNRYGQQLGIKLPDSSPQGPLPLSVRNEWTGSIQTTNKALQFQRLKEEAQRSSVSLQTPWEGVWLGDFKLDNQLSVAKIRHKGVDSMLVGEVQLTPRPIGSSLRAGESLGVLLPQAKSFLWKMGEEN